MTGSDSTHGVFLDANHRLHGIQKIMLAIGAAGWAACVFGWTQNPTQFFRSYLVAFLFCLGLPIGSMALLMIYNITGGAWGAVTRRLLESATRTLPLVALLFLPVLLGMQELYEWARPEAMAHDELLQHKSPYLNVPFFVTRAAFYFVVWILLMRALNSWSLRQDSTTDATPGKRLEMLSRGGLVLVGFTMSFASIDWAMSLEPHWFSTLYGILIMGGQVLSAMALVIPMTVLLSRNEGDPLHGVLGKEQLHDLGKFLFAFVMLWSYFALSQYLIIWAANLPEEIPWYLKRTAGGWQYVAGLVVLVQFVLPFLILLSRRVKQNPGAIAGVALLVVMARFVDLYWMITPAFSPGRFTVHWLDVAALLGVSGIWFAVYVEQLKNRSLVAVNDPSLPVHHR